MHSSMRSGFSSCKCMSTRSSAYWHFSSYVFGKLRRARSCSTVSRDFSMIFMVFPCSAYAKSCAGQGRVMVHYVSVRALKFFRSASSVVLFANCASHRCDLHPPRAGRAGLPGPSAADDKGGGPQCAASHGVLHGTPVEGLVHYGLPAERAVSFLTVLILLLAMLGSSLL